MPVNDRQLLTTVSAAQLVSSVLGMALALRRRYSFDVSFMHGHPNNVARESIFQGTALSAPVTTLVAQAIATAVLSRRPSPIALRAIGVIGAFDVPGYLAERLVRRRLTPAGWDPLESPLILTEISLAAAMPLLARRLRGQTEAES